MSKEVSVDIDDRLDFEYFYFILQQRNKDKILLEIIKKQYPLREIILIKQKKSA